MTRTCFASQKQTYAFYLIDIVTVTLNQNAHSTPHQRPSVRGSEVHDGKNRNFNRLAAFRLV